MDLCIFLHFSILNNANVPNFFTKQKKGKLFLNIPYSNEMAAIRGSCPKREVCESNADNMEKPEYFCNFVWSGRISYATGQSCTEFLVTGY